MEITAHYLSIFSEYIHNTNSSVDKPVCKSEELYSLIFPSFCPLTKAKRNDLRRMIVQLNGEAAPEALFYDFWDSPILILCKPFIYYLFLLAR